MKPLPLLLSLLAVAFVATFVLLGRGAQNQPSPNQPTSAPLPVDTSLDEVDPILPEVEIPLPQVPLLEGPFTPDPLLVTFVEKELGRTYDQPPIFRPASTEEIIAATQTAVEATLAREEMKDLKTAARHLGFLPEFSQLDQLLITIGAAEVRGLMTPEANLISNDFEASSPPEQAALVNLLAQSLLWETRRNPNSSVLTPDELIAEDIRVRLLALAVERKFREGLPDYPPSLKENMRESIMLGVPAFFHELTTFAEFQLLPKIDLTKLTQASASLTQPPLSPHSVSLLLLAYPSLPKEKETTPDAEHPYYLGPITLSITLLEATSAEEALNLSTALVTDSVKVEGNSLKWQLTFDKAETAQTTSTLLKSYFRFLNTDFQIEFTVEGTQLTVETRAKSD